MTTGKPPTSRPALTNEEVMLAASLKISPEEYAQQKEKMRQMQQAGIIQNGGR
jgi:phage I-like protein